MLRFHSPKDQRYSGSIAENPENFSPLLAADADLDTVAEELIDRLRRAIRRGRPDLARRLHADIVGLGREVAVYELSSASSAVEGGNR